MSEKLYDAKDVIRCCYKLSDTDIDCLFKLIELNKPVTSDELSQMMKVSKTTVENSLKKLIDSGLVIRSKSEDKKIGRPKYYYSIVENIINKIREDLLNCSKKMQLSL
ncbi:MULTISPECIES: helix-turn-helix domain-containing protein [Sulfurisphaera]|uniref:TrmB family transcriptional regulator n=2 Tax=Sulfurisphaera tokodaii TaxID=111955 RepID=Q973B2_SULTO|nr:helix-turn-helix domain-containing protein [Sulfurisphaera tokodaii]BAB66001.1 putative TrmB family transcriptional regulator [Sulfurisphaera tokodaii str. 7]HII73965.1 HTH domain-containing protein [Sulfurisphaera tokodaii]